MNYSRKGHGESLMTNTNTNSKSAFIISLIELEGASWPESIIITDQQNSYGVDAKGKHFGYQNTDLKSAPGKPHLCFPFSFLLPSSPRHATL